MSTFHAFVQHWNQSSLEEVTKVCKGAQIKEIKFDCFAYADDIAITCRTAEDLQASLDKANKIMTWSGLKFQPAKCGVLSITFSKEIKKIDGKDVPNIRIDDSYKYLGVEVSADVKKTPIQTLKKIKDDLVKLEKSILLPYQNIAAYDMFLHSKLVFLLRNFNVFSQHIDINEGLQLAVQKRIKKILGIPKYASSDYLYADKDKGGVGLTSVKTEYALQSIVGAYRMLICEDETVANTTVLDLRRAGTKIEINSI